MSIPTLQCPFEPSHQIPAKSFSKHLTKCQRQHPDVKFARCPLNSSHLMKEDQIKEHVRKCPDRVHIEAYKYRISTVSATHFGPIDPAENLIYNSSAPEVVRSSSSGTTLENDEECWDGYNYKTYDPVERCRQKIEENKSFIVPCAIKFVGTNVDIAMIKKEFKNDEVVQRQIIKNEVSSDRSYSPDEIVHKGNSDVNSRAMLKSGKDSKLNSEHDSNREMYCDSRYDIKEKYFRSERNLHNQNARSGYSRDDEPHRDSNRSNPYSGRNHDRYDRKPYGFSSDQSYGYKSGVGSRHRTREGNTHRYEPYGSPHNRRSNDQEGKGDLQQYSKHDRNY